MKKLFFLFLLPVISFNCQKDTSTPNGTTSLPTVTTTAVTSITSTSVLSGGNVSSDGGETVTARGVCLSTSQNPTVANNKTNDGTGTGSYSSSITGLTANTIYYVRAYATNSIGTGYGNQLSFTTSLLSTTPTLTTSSITIITNTSSYSGGNITSDGGATVTARGVCWSTSQNPTIANNKTTDGTGTGNYTSSLTGLAPNAIYYVRAYATNSIGTGYGNQLSFTTLQTYSPPTVTICSQIWMLKNLDVDTYRNGDPIPQVTDQTQWKNLTTGAWCYFYNDPANGVVFGKLYNWYAVNDPRGLAPTGWHIPSDGEWTTLTNCLGGESVAGDKLRATILWLPNLAGQYTATNSSGFTALPGAGRDYLGAWDGPGPNPAGHSGVWWTSTPSGALTSWLRRMSRWAQENYFVRSNDDNPSGMSVRCVRD